MSRSKATVVAVLSALLLIGAALAASGITADEILDEMEDVFSVDADDTRASWRR